jgi:hypothetical protein
MLERRSKRSHSPDEALQFLIESLADRSEVRAVALVNERGRILAGTGSAPDLRGLARLAGPIEDHEDFEEVTRGTDLFARPVPFATGTAYLAALGTRMRRLGDAVNGIARIARTRPS